MNYKEIENKLVEFAHKKEGKDLPIHYVSIGTAVDFAIELAKNCSIPDVSESLPLAENLLSRIISADQNVVKNYDTSDFVIRDLYNQCKELVSVIKSNSH